LSLSCVADQTLHDCFANRLKPDSTGIAPGQGGRYPTQEIGGVTGFMTDMNAS
jgi:hypothetical protein